MRLWILLVCTLGLFSFGQATFRFVGVDPESPTPGEEATVQFEIVSHTMDYGGWIFKATVSTGTTLIHSANEGSWTCQNNQYSHSCRRGITSTTAPDTVFSGKMTIPSGRIEARINAYGNLETYYPWNNPNTVIQDSDSTSGYFYTGAAKYALTPSILNTPSSVTPGEVLPLDLSLANEGPSNGRSATCRVRLTVAGDSSWVAPPSGCTSTGDMEWNCVSSADVPASGSHTTAAWRLAIPADYRSDVSLLVDQCNAQGTATSPAPSASITVPFGAPSWNISTLFAEESAQSIEMDNIIEIAAVLNNVGPSTSLSTLCTWRFSVPSLMFDSFNAAAGSCSSSLIENNEAMEVSCELDVIGSTATVPILSVSAKPELAGTPSFDVTMDCVDESGGSIPSAKTTIMVIEHLDGVAMRVEVVNGKLEASEKRQQNDYVAQELGETNDGQLIFDEALMFVFNATSEGALYARNITCNVELSGRDAALLTPPSFNSSSSTCEDMGTLLSGVRVWRCTFGELWADQPSIREFVMIPDSRVETFDVLVECFTNYPQSVSNPVFQQAFQLIHVDNVPAEGDGSQRLDDSSSSDNSNTLIVGLSVGIGVPLLLIVVALLLLFIILRRRKMQRLQRSKEDMRRDAELDLYATGSNGSFGGPRNNTVKGGVMNVVSENYQRTSSWEIPFAELEFDEEIGKGCFGTVWRGTWRETTVAIKMFNSIMDSETAKANFKAECEIMKHLRPHTNVMQLFGVSMEDGTPWCLVMEFLAQGNLFQYLKQQASSKDKKKAAKSERNKTAVRMAREIAAGMHHLHSENIVHRDLAARNVLLTGDLTVKVADFGLSTADSDEEQTQTIPIRWTPPEYFHKRTFDKKSDVWSYGVLLWEIMNEGKTPYSTMRTEEVINAVVDGHVLTLDEDAPSVLKIVMDRCFRYNPDERPTFKDIVKMLKDDKEWK
ncbi:Mast/stem cell growth factor receptor [Balamuthia mandrillaris]